MDNGDPANTAVPADPIPPGEPAEVGEAPPMALCGDPAGERGPGRAAVAGRGDRAPPRPAASRSDVTETVARVES